MARRKCRIIKESERTMANLYKFQINMSTLAELKILNLYINSNKSSHIQTIFA